CDGDLEAAYDARDLVVGWDLQRIVELLQGRWFLRAGDVAAQNRLLLRRQETNDIVAHENTLHRFARGELPFARPARLPRRPHPGCEEATVSGKDRLAGASAHTLDAVWRRTRADTGVKSVQ